MTASIINIGDELLIGQVVNTNASWMGDELNKANITVKEIVVTSDNVESITYHLERCMTLSNVIIITGGLGPTKDDITKNTLCKFFNDTLIVHEETRDFISSYFKSRNLPMLEVNNWQSMVPSRCSVLQNKLGTAPGMWFEEQDKIIVSLPGVPYEMKYLMTEYVIPRLLSLNGDNSIIHKTVLTCGLGESFIAEKIATWEDKLPKHIKLAYLPNLGIVRLRLSAYGTNKEQLNDELEYQLTKLQTLINDHIYGYDNDTLAKVIGDMLCRQKATISTAESCTGGNIAALITSIPGASNYYKGGIVCYSNEAKISTLTVPSQIIETHGAVSEETAMAMAKGCITTMRTNFAIATTGISGPDEERSNIPIGTVFIAIAHNDNVICRKYCFPTSRTEHQLRTTNQAIFDLWNILKEV